MHLFRCHESQTMWQVRNIFDQEWQKELFNYEFPRIMSLFCFLVLRLVLLALIKIAEVTVIMTGKDRSNNIVKLLEVTT